MQMCCAVPRNFQFCPSLAITGVFYVVAGIICLIISFTDIRQQVFQQFQTPNFVQTREEEEKMLESTGPAPSPSIFTKYLKFEIILLIFMFLAFCCNGGPQHWYVDLSYTFVYCFRNWSLSLASTLISLSWVATMIGRFVGTILTGYIHPKIYILLDIFLVMISWIGLIIFWDPAKYATNGPIWFFTLLMNFGYSTMYANLVALGSEYFDTTRIYSTIFGLGNFTGQFFVYKAAEILPNSVSQWLIVGSIFASGLGVFSLLLFVSGQILKKSKKLRPEFLS